MIQPKENLKDRIFGKWLVIEQAEDYVAPGSEKHYEAWRCICSCENHTISNVRKSALVSGRSTQCSVCARRESQKQAIKKIIKHGDYKDRLYRIWHLMKRRCYEQTNEHYRWYGERGIRVCDEWLESYDNFKQWALNNGYEDTLSIDRIDVNGNYCPDNCKWSTVKEQCNNRRNNLYITLKNTTHTLKEWSEITGINYQTLKNRIYNYGWSVEKALTTPAKNTKSKGE